MTGLVLVSGDIPKFRKAHNERTSYRYWDNAEITEQCDGSFTHNDGYVRYAAT